MLRALALSLVSLLGHSTVALAQATTPQEPLPAYRYRVLGIFNAETGAPVETALVSDIVSGAAAYSSNTGTLALTFLPEGASVIRVQKIGFQPLMQAVEISPRDTVPLTVILLPLPTLATVTTTETALEFVLPRLRGFEERRRGGSGRFLAEADLRKNDNRTLTSLVRAMGNINFACPRAGPDLGKCFPVSGRQQSKFAILGGTCAIPVYIDGIQSPDGDLERLRAIDYAGIEYYSGSSTIPAQFNGTGSACGVLLLWTRDR